MVSEKSNETKNLGNTDFSLAEYNNLRNEIVARVGIEHQLISISLIALGALLAVGLKTENISLFLLYPALITVLAAMWRDNQIRIGEISSYIRNRIAKKVGEDNIGWEVAQNLFYTGKSKQQHKLLTLLGKRGSFIGIEILVIVAGLSVAKFEIMHFDITEIISLAIGIISLIITSMVLVLPMKIPEVPTLPHKHHVDASEQVINQSRS